MYGRRLHSHRANCAVTFYVIGCQFSCLHYMITDTSDSIIISQVDRTTRDVRSIYLFGFFPFVHSRCTAINIFQWDVCSQCFLRYDGVFELKRVFSIFTNDLIEKNKRAGIQPFYINSQYYKQGGRYVACGEHQNICIPAEISGNCVLALTRVKQGSSGLYCNWPRPLFVGSIPPWSQSYVIKHFCLRTEMINGINYYN